MSPSRGQPGRSARTLRHFPDTRVTAQPWRGVGGSCLLEASASGWTSRIPRRRGDRLRGVPQQAGAAGQRPKFISGAFCLRKGWVRGCGRRGYSRLVRGLEAASLGQTPPGCLCGAGESSGGTQSPRGPVRLRGGPAVPSQLKVTAKIQHFTTLSAALRVVCVLKYPFSGESTRANDAKKKEKDYLECPGSVVNYCWRAGDGEGELFPQRWIGPVLKVGSGTWAKLLLNRSVGRRKERRNDFWENTSVLFDFTVCPLTKGSTVSIIMKFLKQHPAPLQS